MRSKKELRRQWRYHSRMCLWYTLTGNFVQYGYHCNEMIRVEDQLTGLSA